MPFSKPCATFIHFKKLPVEIRVLIWEFAAQHLRIVHLTKKKLAVDDDPDWWKIVRSDKSTGEPSQCLEDDDESDYGSWYLVKDEIEKIDWQVAAKRLLTAEDKYQGGMSRAEAKAIVVKGFSSRPLWPGLDYPECLCGIKSESPVPGVLLAYRESFGVGCRVFSRAFGILGAKPQTYFNFSQDSLYLDGLRPYGRGPDGLFELRNMLFD